MRPLELDFLKERGPASWVGAALLVVGIGAALGAAAEYFALESQLARAEDAVRQSGRALRKKPLATSVKADPQKVALEFQHARDVMLRLRLPWRELFGALESARNPNVALLSIESENDKRRVKIAGEAKDLESMVAYLGTLRQRPALGDVYIESHELQVKDPQRPVRFVLTASWKVDK